MKTLAPGVKIGLKFLFSIAFFSVLFSFIKANELLEVLARVNWSWFAVSFLLTPVMLWASCAKWKVLLDQKGKSVSMGELIRIYFIGYFFSNILPSTVGGDVVRSFYAGRCIDNQAYSAVSVFLERFTGLILLLTLVVFMPLLQPGLYLSPYIYVPALAAAFLLVIFAIIGLAADPVAIYNFISAKIISVLQVCTRLPVLKHLGIFWKSAIKLLGLVGTKVEKVSRELHGAIGAIQGDKVLVLRIILLTMLFYLLAMVNVYVSYKAFGAVVGFIAVCAIMPTALFAAQFPVTLLGNLGYFESIFVGFFLLAGVPAAESLAMGLLLRVKMLTLGMIGYFLYISYKRKLSSVEDDGPEFTRR